MSVFSFSCPAWNVHVPHYIVNYGLPDSTVFLEAHNWKDLLNYVTEHKVCGLIFPTNFCLQNF